MGRRMGTGIAGHAPMRLATIAVAAAVALAGLVATPAAAYAQVAGSVSYQSEGQTVSRAFGTPAEVAAFASSLDADSCTIDVLSNWTLDAPFTVKADKNVTVNLNGHVIARRGLGSSNGYAVEVGGSGSGKVAFNGGDTGLAHMGNLSDSGRFWTYSPLSGTTPVYGGLITGGWSDGGAGGVYVHAGSEVAFNDVTIEGNRAKNGAGIYVVASDVTLTLAGTTSVARNAATGDGGGICHNSSGGTVRLGDSATVLKNTAAGNGGGIYDASDDTTFVIDGSAEVRENEATGSKSDGGGIYLNDRADVKLTNGGSIVWNRAGRNGAGIYVDEGTSDISLDDDSTIRFNIATQSGGGIYYNGVEGIINVRGGSSIYHNSAVSGQGGGVYSAWNYTEFYIRGGTIRQNSAGTAGGGMYLEDYSTVELSDGGQVCENTTRGDGGGIYVNDDGTSVSLTGDSAVTSNTAEGNGGGIYLNDNTTLTIKGGKISSNKAVDGAGLYVARSSVVRLNGGTSISANTASGNGGGIYDDNARLEVTTTGENNAIANNSAAKNGGGICVKKGDVTTSSITLTGITLTGNRADVGGGMWLAGDLYLTDLTVTSNTATTNGGGIWSDDIGDALGMFGTIVIGGNKVGKADNNLALHGTRKMTSSSSNPISRDSRIGVTVTDYTGEDDRQLTTGSDFLKLIPTTFLDNVRSDNSDYSIVKRTKDGEDTLYLSNTPTTYTVKT